MECPATGSVTFAFKVPEGKSVQGEVAIEAIATLVDSTPEHNVSLWDVRTGKGITRLDEVIADDPRSPPRGSGPFAGLRFAVAAGENPALRLRAQGSTSGCGSTGRCLPRWRIAELVVARWAPARGLYPPRFAH